MAALARAGAIDDARVAATRAETLARRGYGDAAIRADLQRRMIAPEAVADAVDALEPEAARLRRTVENETVTPGLLRRLSARGFSRESVDAVASTFALDT